MNDILKRLTVYLYEQKTKKYTITHDGLKEFGILPRAPQELLLKMLTCIKHQCDIDAFIFEVKYEEMGFNDRSNFYRARKVLIDRQFIYFDKDKYIINPHMINYYSRRQLEYMYKLFGIKKEITFVWK